MKTTPKQNLDTSGKDFGRVLDVHGIFVTWTEGADADGLAVAIGLARRYHDERLALCVESIDWSGHGIRVTLKVPDYHPMVDAIADLIRSPGYVTIAYPVDEYDYR